MAGVTGMTGVGNHLRDTVNNPHPVSQFPQEQNAPVGGDIAAGEISSDVFAGNRFEREGKLGILAHGSLNSTLLFFVFVICLTI